MTLAAENYDFIKKDFIDSIIVNKEFGNLDEDRIIPITISTIEMDRDGEVVLPSAFEKDIDVYKKNPVVLLFHGHRSIPIAKCIDIEILSDRVIGKLYVSKTSLGNDVLTLIKEGCLKGVSAGFVPIAYEESPPIHKIPQEALRTSMGKKCVKLYKRVELVEISLLPIPSNRSALVEYAGKGNNVANLIVKSFDIEKQSDLEIIIKEWMDAQKPKYTLKSLLNWDESEHPRDKSGMFSEKPHVSAVLDPIQESVYHPVNTSSTKSQNQMSFEQSKKMDETNKKLQDIAVNTNMMRRDTNEIKDQGSWSTWFKKYGVVIASTVGFYMLWKYGKKVPIVKSLKSNEEEVGRALETVKDYLDKGKELGFEDTEEYKKMEKFYKDTISKINEIKPKGLSDLLITTKEMSAETFVEEEHPRHTDGKFRKKSEGSGVKKAKPQEVSEEIKHPPKEDIPEEKISKKEDSKEASIKEETRDFTPEETFHLKQWAKKNTGKLLVATVAAPLVIIPVKIGSRFFKFLYSKSTRELVNFTSLTKKERIAFLRQAEPGDVFLQSSKTYEGFGAYVQDVIDIVKKNPNKAKWAIQDPIGRAMENVEYPHSALVVGHYDKAFHEELMNSIPMSIRDKKNFTSEQKKKAHSALTLIVHSSGIGFSPITKAEISSLVQKIKKVKAQGDIDKLTKELEGKVGAEFNRVTKEVQKKYLSTPEGRKQLWEDYKHRILLVLGSTDAKHEGTLRMVAQGMPFGGGIGALLRTKVPLEERKVMSGKIKDVFFARGKTNPKIQFAVDEVSRTPTDKRNIDIMLRNSMYPFFEPLKGKFSEKVLWKDDAMVCHGAVAALYEQFGGVKLGKEFRYMGANDLIGDKKFASMILEAKRKRIYEREDWKPAEEIINRNKLLSKTTIAGGTASALGTAATILYPEETKEQLRNVRDKLNKGLSNLLITTKEMSKEEFKEEEHPRDSDGKFTDKVGGDTFSGVSPEKGSWGGYRESSGRLPKDPIEAKQRLEEKIKKSKPNINDDELKREVLDYAVKNKKADLAFLINDPVEYQKQREQEILIDASKDKYRQINFKGQKIKIDGEEDVNNARNEIKNSTTKWKQEIQKSESIVDAWDKFRVEESDNVEKSRAKLILGTAAVITAVGLASLILKRKGMSESGFVINPDLSKTALRKVGFEGNINPLEAPSDTLFRVLNVVKKSKIRGGVVSDAAKWSEVNVDDADLGFFNKMIGRFLYGKNKSVFTGPELIGFKNNRWGLGQYHRIETSYNYKPHASDIGSKFGLRLYNKTDKNALELNPLSVAIERGWIPYKATGKRLIPGLSKTTDGLWDLEDEQKFLSYLYSKKKSSKAVKTTIDKLIQNNEEIDVITFSMKKSAIPKEIDRATDPDDIKKFEGSANNYESFIDSVSKFGPTVSKKVLALLTVTSGAVGAGSATMYFFDKDLESALSSFGKEGEQTDLSKILKIGDNKNKRVEELKQEQKTEEAKKKRIDSEMVKESIRQNVINELIKELEIRNPHEGAINSRSFTEAVIRKRFSEKILKELNYSDTKNGIMDLRKDLKRPQNREMILDHVNKVVNEGIEEYRNELIRKASLEQIQKIRADLPKGSITEGSTTEEITTEPVEKKELSLFDLIVKEFSEQSKDLGLNIKAIFNEITDLMAIETASMFADISQSCKEVIESGMPGDSKFEELNQVLTEIYTYMKDQAKKGISEDNKIVKSFDKNESQADNAESEDIPDPNETCKICGKVATVEHISKCEKSSCPFSFVAGIEKKE